MNVRGWLHRCPTWILVMGVVIVPVLALAMPDVVRIPRAKSARPGAPAATALFSHRTHEPLRCYQCHPTVFPQARVAFTHADMQQGKFCGACHDGQRAPATTTYTCVTCHATR